MKEQWVELKRFKNLYSVSSLGRVMANERRVRFVSKKGKESWRIKKSKIMSQQKQNGGYMICHISIDGFRKASTVHSLVLEGFIGPRPLDFDICHGNGNRLDNRLKNLRYDTRSNDFADAKKHGTFYKRITANKLNPNQVLRIRKLLGEVSVKDLAKKYKVHEQTITRIKRRELWKHI